MRANEQHAAEQGSKLTLKATQQATPARFCFGGETIEGGATLVLGGMCWMCTCVWVEWLGCLGSVLIGHSRIWITCCLYFVVCYVGELEV